MGSRQGRRTDGRLASWAPPGPSPPPGSVALFRRSKPETTPEAAEPTSESAVQKKGRRTPSRKEAEAANKARAKVPRTRKEMAAAQKLQRSQSSSQVRQAMRNGDDRFLPARDKGPVRRFIRDYVDSRFSFIELLIPLMLVVLILGFTGNPTVTTYANLAMLSVFLLIIVDLVRLRFRLKRELTTRFPDAATNGTTYYAVTRSMQMRFMRMPKAQVKVGQQLPDSYR